MRRRQLLEVSAVRLGGVLFYTLDQGPSRAWAQPVPAEVVRVPLEFFTRQEARDAAAACARIFPSDESGPGASEAGVAIYIDRQLAGPYGKDRFRYTRGPFAEGAPEQGYQGRKTPRQIYRAGLGGIRGLADLSPDAQDARLREIEGSLFFRLLRTHTIEGMFCDPMHGGNANLVGWRLIGFPGPQLSYRDEVDRHHGRPYRPAPRSLHQILGRSHAGHPPAPRDAKTKTR